ncbi:MAG: hypothetical protein ISR90_00330 [Candidatus Marinimicrobia bacterium]|nr:hypothetical protein [Candidatus Neomarinimicrobiota bacterium]MBL7022488.1 hypothetical protein [Candidatus Neomarinimicrobiota bacterium]MBL7108657.1 hypothetical protein [Candidatus Neomarinimicrobiota bacterium]
MKKIMFFALLVIGFAFSQTTVNPDISAIGDLIIDQDGGISSSGVELAIQGYVNPFARADVFLHKHADHEAIHLEEAVISLERGLPFNLGMRFGKFRPDIGKINKEHAHTLFFIEAPKSMQDMLGDEMWGTLGVESNWLLPLSWYSKLSAGYFTKAMGTAHSHDEEEDPDEHSEETATAISARLSHFFDLNDVTHLEIGSGYYRDIENSESHLHHVFEMDFKFKWRPDTYRSITWQGEIFRKSPIDNPDNKSKLAGYSWMNYQFNKRWNIGVITDCIYFFNIEEEKHQSVGAFFGFSPAEESSVFRLTVSQENHGGETNLNILGQIIWALGPHKPHQF